MILFGLAAEGSSLSLHQGTRFLTRERFSIARPFDFTAWGVGLTLLILYLLRRVGVLTPGSSLIVAEVILALTPGFFYLFLHLDKLRVIPPLWRWLNRTLGDIEVSGEGIVQMRFRRAPRERRVSWTELETLWVETTQRSGTWFDIVGKSESLVLSSDSLYEPERFRTTVELSSGRKFSGAVADRAVRTHVCEVVRGRTSCRLLLLAFSRLFLGIFLLAVAGFAIPRFHDFLEQGTRLWEDLVPYLFVTLVLGSMLVPMTARGGPPELLRNSPEGIFARVPAGSFPRFTPWPEIRGIDVQIRKGGWVVYEMRTSGEAYRFKAGLIRNLDLIKRAATSAPPSRDG